MCGKNYSAFDPVDLKDYNVQSEKKILFNPIRQSPQTLSLPGVNFLVYTIEFLHHWVLWLIMYTHVGFINKFGVYFTLNHLAIREGQINWK